MDKHQIKNVRTNTKLIELTLAFISLQQVRGTLSPSCPCRLFPLQREKAKSDGLRIPQHSNWGEKVHLNGVGGLVNFDKLKC